jgi:hypothetical protein
MRTGTPFFIAISRSANSAGSCKASLAISVVWVRPSLKVPCGELTLAAISALLTSLAVSPLAASAAVSKAMRTACGEPPETCTRATPGICATAGLSSVSVRSYSFSGGRLVEVSATNSTGICEVSNLKYCGGAGRSAGRSGAAALIAACTSRAALSALRPRLKRICTNAAPSLLSECISSMPGMRPRWRSSGATTVDAMVCALAPGCCTTM